LQPVPRPVVCVSPRTTNVPTKQVARFGQRRGAGYKRARVAGIAKQTFVKKSEAAVNSGRTGHAPIPAHIQTK
jgi:hypothetical protein